ncbi:UNKNOWN [Stylonychia lemnae]|uniref:Uncharacterized protein n=1 Tax=Stylonychia lemnae TaxID=5949 RepID=A0A078AQ02_STYLE|nr:UNKNOWN [Stylonychia lemnae]|eukprot:CDW84051.1 UNKNOWN [Stylonychia lemnae]
MGIDTYQQSIFDNKFCDENVFKQRNLKLMDSKYNLNSKISLFSDIELQEQNINPLNVALIKIVTITKKKTTIAKDKSVLLFTSLKPISDLDKKYIAYLTQQVEAFGDNALEQYQLIQRFKSQMFESVYEFYETNAQKIIQAKDQNGIEFDFDQIDVRPLLYIKLYGQYQEARVRLIQPVFAKYIVAKIIVDKDSGLNERVKHLNQLRADKELDQYNFTFRGYIFDPK